FELEDEIVVEPFGLQIAWAVLELQPTFGRDAELGFSAGEFFPAGEVFAVEEGFEIQWFEFHIGKLEFSPGSDDETGAEGAVRLIFLSHFAVQDAVGPDRELVIAVDSRRRLYG